MRKIKSISVGKSIQLIDIRTRGFSLIELMTVIAIMGITLSIAAPSFTRLIAEQRLRNTANEFHSGFVLARSASITRNTAVIIEPRSLSGWSSGFEVHVTQNGVKTVLKTSPALSGVTIAGTPSAVTYASTGRTTQSGIAITLKSNANPEILRCVSVDSSGRPAVVKGGCGP